MKHARWLSATAAGLLLVTVGAGSASAGGTTDVSIMLQAQYVTEVVVSVALHVTCEGEPLFGVVHVTVQQEPPETQSTTVGTGGQVVVCDGNQHDVAVNVTGGASAASTSARRSRLRPSSPPPAPIRTRDRSPSGSELPSGGCGLDDRGARPATSDLR